MASDEDDPRQDDADDVQLGGEHAGEEQEGTSLELRGDRPVAASTPTSEVDSRATPPGPGLVERWPSHFSSGQGTTASQGPVTLSTYSSHQGPLPPARVLAEYNALDPTYGERIMRMAEASTTEPVRILDKVVDAEILRAKRGQNVAFAVVGTALIAAIVLFAVHIPIGGAACVSFPVAFFVKYLVGDRSEPPDVPEPPDPS